MTTLNEQQLSGGAGAAALAVACRVAGEAEGWKLLALRNAEAAARLMERTNGRGMEIERLTRERAQMERLALDAERDLAESRADAAQLQSEVIALQEELDRVQREKTELEAVLEGAVSDVVVTRAELRDVGLDLEDADCLDAELVDAWDEATEGADVGGAKLERLRAALAATRRRVVRRQTAAGMRERGARGFPGAEVRRG